MADQGAFVLDGDAVTVEGLTFAGIGDARFSPDSGELDIDAAREATGEATAELASVVAATNRSGKDVDVALIHDPSRLDALFGEVPLVLAGHYHSRTVRLDESGTRVMVEGSTGGAGISVGALDRLEAGEPLPLEASLLYFATTGEQARRLVAWDEVTVGGLGLSSVQIDRTPGAAGRGAGAPGGADRRRPSVEPSEDPSTPTGEGTPTSAATWSSRPS